MRIVVQIISLLWRDITTSQFFMWVVPVWSQFFCVLLFGLFQVVFFRRTVSFRFLSRVNALLCTLIWLSLTRIGVQIIVWSTCWLLCCATTSYLGINVPFTSDSHILYEICVELVGIPPFLAHLWGAYAIPVALSGVWRPSSVVNRPSCVVCVHHNYQK